MAQTSRERYQQPLLLAASICNSTSIAMPAGEHAPAAATGLLCQQQQQHLAEHVEPFL
jgi:hypothetical protein